MRVFTRKNLVRAGLGGYLAGTLLMVTGCGHHAAKLTAEQIKAFDSAPAEVRQTWEKALAADQANDYETAGASLDSLQQMTLSEPQRHALDAELLAFGERVMKAVEKNDPAAIKAVQNSQKSRARSNR